MLTPRREQELMVARETHLACLLGWVSALSFAFFAQMAYWVTGARWLLDLVGLFAVVGGVFVALARRPLRRIRELEEFY